MRRLGERLLEEACMVLGRVLVVTLWTAEGVRRAREARAPWR